MAKIATAVEVIHKPVKFEGAEREEFLAHLKHVWHLKGAVLDMTLAALKQYSSRGGNHYPNGVSHIVAQAGEIRKLRCAAQTPEEFLDAVERTVSI